MEPVANYDLAAEALVVTTGLFPAPLTNADAREARELPAEWYRRTCDFMRSNRQARFRMHPTPDPERTAKRLREPVDVDKIAANMQDGALVAAYATKLEEARRYVLQLFPELHIEHLTGVDYVQPSLSALGAAYSVMALCGQRDHLMHELAAGTVTSDQSEAFQSLFPGLFSMVQEYLRYERGRMTRNRDRAAFFVETTLRTFLGMSPDPRELTSPADEIPEGEAPPPAPAVPSLEIDFRGMQTRQQRVDSPV